jgi:hypothetical protein
MSVDMSREAVSARLERVGALSDLRAERRLDAKIDYGPAAVDLRLQRVAALRRLCLDLAAAPEPDPGSVPSR